MLTPCTGFARVIGQWTKRWYRYHDVSDYTAWAWNDLCHAKLFSRHKTLSTTRNAVGPAAKLERSVKLGLNWPANTMYATWSWRENKRIASRYIGQKPNSLLPVTDTRTDKCVFCHQSTCWVCWICLSVSRLAQLKCYGIEWAFGSARASQFALQQKLINAGDCTSMNSAGTFIFTTFFPHDKHWRHPTMSFKQQPVARQLPKQPPRQVPA